MTSCIGRSRALRFIMLLRPCKAAALLSTLAASAAPAADPPTDFSGVVEERCQTCGEIVPSER